jgi:hypothetical protein
MIWWAQTQGPQPVSTFSNAYNIAQGTSLTFIQHIGTISRTAVKFDTGNAFLGSRPQAITFSYRRIGNPTGVIKTGIRKASDDSFIPISEWPAEYTAPGFGNNSNLYTVRAEGGNSYAMVANDKISIEYTGTATAGIEILMNPQQANPVSLFTTQQYTGTYASSANALAATIKTKAIT